MLHKKHINVPKYNIDQIDSLYQGRKRLFESSESYPETGKTDIIDANYPDQSIRKKTVFK